jgi:hypothetical protein
MAGPRREETTIVMVPWRYYWPGMKKEIVHFMKSYMKYQLN